MLYYAQSIIDTDNPKFRAGLERLFKVSKAMEAAKARGGVVGKLQQGLCAASGLLAFGRLYLLPTVPNELPKSVRMSPAW